MPQLGVYNWSSTLPGLLAQRFILVQDLVS